MIKMLLSELSHLLGAEMPNLETQFEGVSIDTRTLQPHNLYVAIRGEQLDGHQFVLEAKQKGARAALVSEQVAVDLPQIKVPDTIKALGQLSVAWRKRFPIPLIGVTGSNGKTTLKNMISSILRAATEPKAVLATEGNLNNHIGVPLTLLKLNSLHRFGVIEMGMNHFGEIAYLTRLTEPRVAVINNAAAAHLEALQSIAGVARAKGEIFQGLVPLGTAILNRDDTYFDYWVSLLDKKPHLSFGFHSAADVVGTVKENALTIKTPQGTFMVRLPLLGMHNQMNALAATATTLALKIELPAIKQGLESMVPAPGRMRQYTLANGASIIDDTYNANPFSLQAAVKTLAEFSGTKIIVLGDMKELGPDAKTIHFDSGKKIREAGIDYLFTLGSLTAESAAGFGPNSLHFNEREALLTALKPHINKNVTILIKGSRSMKMENILMGIVPKEELDPIH